MQDSPIKGIVIPDQRRNLREAVLLGTGYLGSPKNFPDGGPRLKLLPVESFSSRKYLEKAPAKD